jgi:biotin carboxylase
VKESKTFLSKHYILVCYPDTSLFVQSTEEAVELAGKIGFPVMIKVNHLT